MGIMVGPGASVVFEGFMRVLFLKVGVDVGVPGDELRSSSMLAVDGETEVDGSMVGSGAADTAGSTLLSKDEYNMDTYTLRGYTSLRPLSLANTTSLGAASLNSFFFLLLCSFRSYWIATKRPSLLTSLPVG